MAKVADKIQRALERLGELLSPPRREPQLQRIPIRVPVSRYPR